MQLVPLMPCVHFTQCLSIQVPVRRALLKSKYQPCVLGCLRMYAVLVGQICSCKGGKQPSCLPAILLSGKEVFVINSLYWTSRQLLCMRKDFPPSLRIKKMAE